MNNIHKSLPKRVTKNDVSEIETLISQALSPVKPRDEFIHDLRYRLTQRDVDAFNQGNLFRSMMLVVVGIFGGLLVIIGAIKAFLSLIQAIRLVKKRSQLQNSIVGMDSTLGVNQGISPSN